jgi:Spy/CpxP family protein refolding chaperone
MWRWIPLTLLLAGCMQPDPAALAIETAEGQCGILQLQRKGALTNEQQQQLKELRSKMESCQKKANGLTGDARSEYNRVYYSEAGLCR